MAKRYRATGCAKLFIVLLIITPIAFFVASYVNGKDPIKFIKGIFEKTETTEIVTDSASPPLNDKDQKIQKLEKDVEFYRLEAENLQKQLDDCKNASN
ncbi:hypothetical protein [Membranihabitans marinus]|uniref:hypothetical protein n=1 Tax=Membranihabitans marinus TaxID=1227546 RepID=UPI001F276304|nr:hypothetical protein [Membranihabitans marinus]